MTMPVARLTMPVWTREPPVPAVIEVLKAGGPVRFIGGRVRDTLCGRPPRSGGISDVDLATPLTPETVCDAAAHAGFKTVTPGLSHGTVVIVGETRCIEVTTLRRDVATDGRRATVAFTDDWVVDAARRDFTFNALSLAPDGALFDPFEGRADLAAGRVRFVGEAQQRIREDYLRVLRFFRFFAWFGRAPVDAGALEACQALQDGVERLSGERVQHEMIRLLEAPNPMPALELMERSGVLDHVIPVRCDNWRRRLARLVTLERGAGSGIRRLAAVITGTDAAALARRWRLSRAQTDRLATLAAPEARINTLDARGLRHVIARAGAARYRDLVLLAWAGAETHAGFDEAFAVADHWTPPVFPVRGSDALKLGLPPGPGVGEVLRRLEAWWEGADYRPNRGALLERLREMVTGGEVPLPHDASRRGCRSTSR